MSKPSVTKKCSGSQAPTSNVPASINWADKGSVTGVKNQGQCGSCWAFSAVGSLEGTYFNENGKLLSLSEQQLVDCAGGAYGNQGCNGGDMPNAFWYVIDNGIATEEKYPYVGKGQKCRYTQDMKAYQIKDCTDVTANKELSLKASIAQNPVAVSVDAGGSGFQFYSRGVFSGKCGTSLNHGVLATGFDSDAGKGYWIIKNSWGASWGSKGYIWLAQNGDGKGQCGINMENSFPSK